MKIILTGGAGFIGSCMLEKLNRMGIEDVLLVDDVKTSVKWKNLVGKKFSSYIQKDEFFENMEEILKAEKEFSVIHLGACSSTVEEDFDYLWKNNVEFTKKLAYNTVKRGFKFIYASSAATYGDGKQGFSDSCDLNLLKPLNRYGYSKHLFDLHAKKEGYFDESRVYGLKFFNVYGPNEYHKDNMASMVFHGFNQIMETGKIKLFKSNDENILDGEQKRDFVYVEDVCEVIAFFLENKIKGGIYNVGSGVAKSFNDLARAIFAATRKEVNIEYIDMPSRLQKQYQSYTVADVSSLKKAGYTRPFTSLEDGVKKYVQNYLVESKNY